MIKILDNVLKTKRKRLLFIGIIMIICILAIGIYRLVYQKGVVSDKKLVTAIHAIDVKKEDIVKNISLVGQTIPKEQVDVAAKYAGRIDSVDAELGQKVTAGQVLIREDSNDAALSVDVNRHAYNQAAADEQTAQAQLDANYNKAKADYDKALATYQRNSQVYAVGGISADDMDAARQQMQDAEAALSAIENQMNAGTASSVLSAQENMAKARSSLTAAQRQENDMTLISSIDGTVGYRQVEAGDMVTVGQKLMSIYDNSSIYVDYQVSEEDLPAFSVGMSLPVNIESLHDTFNGSVIYISPTIDATSMTYILRVSLDNANEALKGGMFARAALKSVLRSDVLAVPKAAVLAKNGKNYVFVIKADNTAERREVTVGTAGDDAVEILGGLSGGENIAVDNLSRLRDGLKVDVLTDGSDAA
ncbi:efflux RND transporter periplasmic adaptor subunit [Pectinatus frisingensis]|uniref:efflux RND transporter periplasmic adaptor subunit n=1 Tax=Pectinatus frisingensis TaxID=865 RepID=UPI0018C6CACD